MNHTKESIENKENLFREPSAGRTIDYDYEHNYEHDYEHEHEHNPCPLDGKSRP